MAFGKGPIEYEKDTIRKMIRIYCRYHHSEKDLCSDCQALWVYASKRLDRCKFGDKKPTCGKCPVHCYQPDMGERVKKVMRYAGPRMIFFHPIDAIRHGIKNKTR